MTQQERFEFRTDDHRLPDWRLELADLLVEDILEMGPGRPAHPAGTPIYLVSHHLDKKGRQFTFHTPGAVALMIDIAASSATRAAALLDDVAGETGSRFTRGFEVADDKISVLFDYFEQAMISAIFSYQAIEAFCNQVIGFKAPPELEIARQTPSGKELVTLTREALERTLSTDEKMATVLPQLLTVKSPKGGKLWHKFVRLKRLRDSLTHLKTGDRYPRPAKDPSVFHLLLTEPASAWPKAAAETIEYFHDGQAFLSWVPRLKERVDRI
jgi:hypothetical protein